MSRLVGAVGVLLVLLAAMVFAAQNGGQRVTIALGWFTLYRVPVTFVAFGGLFFGMLVMLLAGVHTDLRVRSILRERLAAEDREEKERVDSHQQELFPVDETGAVALAWEEERGDAGRSAPVGGGDGSEPDLEVGRRPGPDRVPPSGPEPDRAVDREPDRPVDREPDRSVDREPDRPVDRELDRPADPEPDRPVVGELDRPVDPEPDRAVDGEPERSVDHERDRPVDRELDRPVDREPDRSVDHEPDRPVDPETMRGP